MADKVKTFVENSKKLKRDLWRLLEEFGFVLTFAGSFFYFLYNLQFVDEDDRISNDSVSLLAFLSAIFALVALVRVNQQRTEPEKQTGDKFKERKKYASDKELLNTHLKESLRKAMVSEQQKRALISGGMSSHRKIIRPAVEAPFKSTAYSSTLQSKFKPIVSMDKS